MTIRFEELNRDDMKIFYLVMTLSSYVCSCLQLLKPAILLALEEKLGQYFSSEVGQAWERVFNYIGSKIMKGISKWK